MLWLWFLIGGIWILCGVFGYGLAKGVWRTIIEEDPLVGYKQEEEAACIILGGVLGLIGLITSLILSMATNGKLRLCFKMPKELTWKAKEEEIFSEQFKRAADECLRPFSEQVLEAMKRAADEEVDGEKKQDVPLAPE